MLKSWVSDYYIMRLFSYSSYKTSGEEWLGEVPEHWNVCRLKRICRFEYGDSLDSESRILGGTAVYGSNGVVGHHNEANTVAPCIVIGRKGSFGKVNFGYDPIFAIDTTFFVDARYSNANMRWLYYLLGWLRLDAVTKDSAIPGLDREDAYRRFTPLPKKAEQSDIARFLDHAIDQIERYIRAKEKLIALLEEQKQVMIHDAVTGRIDVRTGKPYPAYKPSGAEWLGNVPALWKVRKLRQCVKIVGGMTPRMEERRFWDGRIPWVTPKDMKREIVSDSSVRVSKAALSDTTLRLINPPVVLMVVRGMILARKIPIAWTSQPVTINQDMKALIPTSDMYAAFLARTLTAAQDTIALWVDVAGHGTRRLPTECWRELIVPIPPIAEQTAILDFIETEITRINDANKCARREIKLLREYRTRLIADVVTGKLDVCEAAANLPKLEAIADGGDETIPAEPDSQQSNITLHNEAPPTTPGASS